jgi:biotin operon repressor
LRTLISEIILTVHSDERRAELEICWEGGSRTELQLRLAANVFERRRTSENTIELIRRLAEHHPDRQIAQTLSRQGRLTASGPPFTQARVASIRVRAGIPAAPAPDPTSQLFTILQAAGELGVSTNTIHRWLRQGLLPGEQATPGAPWRIRLNDEIRARFLPDVPDGYVPLDQAARVLGCARQTVLHKVQRGELRAVQITQGRRKGLRIEVPGGQLDRMINA